MTGTLTSNKNRMLSTINPESRKKKKAQHDAVFSLSSIRKTSSRSVRAQLVSYGDLESPGMELSVTLCDSSSFQKFQAQQTEQPRS